MEQRVRTRGKRARGNPSRLTPANALMELSMLPSRLAAHVQLDAVWLYSPDPPVAALFDAALIGRHLATPWCATPTAVDNSGISSTSVQNISGMNSVQSFNNSAIRLSLQEAFYLLREIRCLAVHAPASTIECDQLPRAHGSDLLEGIPSDGLMTDKQCFDAFTVLESRFVEMVSWVESLMFSHIQPDPPVDHESSTTKTLSHSEAGTRGYTLHFRKKGWLPRSGLQYGAHFVLYRKHPSQVHSDYTVVVMLEVGPNESSPQEGFTSECNMTWIEVSAAARLSAQVSKKLILLYLQTQPGCDMTQIEGLDAVTGHEVHLHRWVPQRHRDR